VVRLGAAGWTTGVVADALGDRRAVAADAAGAGRPHRAGIAVVAALALVHRLRHAGAVHVALAGGAGAVALGAGAAGRHRLLHAEAGRRVAHSVEAAHGLGRAVLRGAAGAGSAAAG